ncbi:MAG: transcriptional repressor [Betaproteobacteria bacterium]|nr:transcriptional repressor [Betaproteobacteria bacterium]
MAVNYRVAAEEMIRSTGARVTNARIEILATLLKAEGALTHSDIESRLAQASGIDRVTVYRVLEWLTEQRLAHKIPGDDRVWRFNVVGTGNEHNHAHFKCTCCNRVICLDDLGRGWTPALPAGFTPQEIELTIKGLCAECSPDNHAHDPRKHQAAVATRRRIARR